MAPCLFYSGLVVVAPIPDLLRLTPYHWAYGNLYLKLRVIVRLADDGLIRFLQVRLSHFNELVQSGFAMRLFHLSSKVTRELITPEIRSSYSWSIDLRLNICASHYRLSVFGLKFSGLHFGVWTLAGYCSFKRKEKIMQKSSSEARKESPLDHTLGSYCWLAYVDYMDISCIIWELLLAEYACAFISAHLASNCAGNAQQHAVAIMFAMKKTSLILTGLELQLGSSLQISMFVGVGFKTQLDRTKVGKHIQRALAWPGLARYVVCHPISALPVRIAREHILGILE
nr:hypothetical protein Iba_chr09aCG6340 [Ipomoea batatas]